MVRVFLSGALALAMVTGSLTAGESEGECLQTGDGIGAFYVTKVAGAVDDGVEQGQELCYRCKYGGRPMVLVFARKTGGKVPELLKSLDAAVDSNDEAQLRGVMTLLGDDESALKQKGQKLAKKTGVNKVPVVVAKDTKSGPASYRIPEDAEITVVVAKDSEVVGTHTFAAKKIDIPALMKQVEGMLN